MDKCLTEIRAYRALELDSAKAKMIKVWLQDDVLTFHANGLLAKQAQAEQDRLNAIAAAAAEQQRIAEAEKAEEKRREREIRQYGRLARS